MDEPFHVAQTQLYCQGNYSYWDPMITTLPGLYVVATALHRLLSFVMVVGCTTAFLRVTNLLLAMLNLIALHKLIASLQPRGSSGGSLFAWALWLSPVSFFCNFLFYTDTGAEFFVVLMFYLAQTRRLQLAALAGAGAVLFRQTNIVWAGCVAGSIAIDEAILQRPRTAARSSIVQQLLQAVRLIVVQMWGFVALAVAFVVFVWWNGGIVVGDRSNHEAVKNYAQLCYAVAFCVALDFAQILNRQFVRYCWLVIRSHMIRSAVVFLLLCVVAFLMVKHGTLVHPYTLADNRHYAFYVWKNILAKERLRYALVPLYAFCGSVMWLRMRQHSSSFVCALFFACVAACVVPARLLEFRYFIMPALMYRLLAGRPADSFSMWCTVAVFALMNVAALAVFALKPFTWPSGDVARFMY
eukprot:TRINITY_DN5275_c0_g1_i1.p1 TRINITY_DN5275_c0_g1~~TRINITY_DN5275_c0_g1_i1.p1  ORF type:complete len:446 (+),score=101.35 TRINITY_DN5275_c0_g1_i1:103-1338(+)